MADLPGIARSVALAILVGCLALGGCADSAADLPKHLEAANAHLAKRRYEPALVAYDRVLAIDPNHFEARRLKAEILYNQAKFAAAEELLVGLRAEQPRNADLLWAMGMVAKEQRKFADALVMFRKLPAERVPRLAVAECLTGTGEHDEAANWLGRLLVDDPWEQQAYYLLSKVEYRRGREAQGRFWGEWFKSQENFRRNEGTARGMEFAGDRLKGMLFRAQTLLQQGRWYAAMSELTRAVQANPNTPMAFYMIGRIMVDLGDTKNAVTAFDRFLALQPGHVEVTRLRTAEQAKLAASGGKVPTPLEVAKRHAAAGQKQLARGAALYAAVSAAVSAAPSAVPSATRGAEDDLARLQAIPQFFDRPGDVFVRLWAMRQAMQRMRQMKLKADPGLRAAWDAELARLAMKL